LISSVAIFFSVFSVFFTFAAEILQGKVIKVIDGDTIATNNSERVRLLGINTPEKGRYGYEEAKEFLEELKMFSYLRKTNVFDYEQKFTYKFSYNFEKLIGSNVYNPLADYYSKNRDALKMSILKNYPSYVEKILFKSGNCMGVGG
jgi:hypothetical protein